MKKKLSITLIILTLGLTFVVFQNFVVESPSENTIQSPVVETVFKPRYANLIYPELLTKSPVGDGIADDTQALQFAINYAIAHAPATLVLNQKYRITKMLIIQRAKDLDVGGSGTIHNSGAVLANGTIRESSSGIFIIRNGSERVRIANLKLIGSWSSDVESTGSADGPGIVIGNFPNTGMLTNKVIVIENNVLEKFNYTAIMLAGQTSTISPPLANQYVLIRNNKISNSSNGIFVYKNSQGITIDKNHITNMTHDGIALDTAAASTQRVADDIASISIQNIRISDNFLEKIGTKHSSIAIMLKGLIYNAVIVKNIIRDVRAPVYQEYVVADKVYGMSVAYGISVGKDAHGNSGADIILSLNDMALIDSKQTKNGLYVGDFRNVIVQGNKFDEISDGLCVRFAYVPNIKFYGNRMQKCEFQADRSAIGIIQTKIGESLIVSQNNSYDGKLLIGNEKTTYRYIPRPSP